MFLEIFDTRSDYEKTMDALVLKSKIRKREKKHEEMIANLNNKTKTQLVAVLASTLMTIPKTAYGFDLTKLISVGGNVQYTILVCSRLIIVSFMAIEVLTGIVNKKDKSELTKILIRYIVGIAMIEGADTLYDAVKGLFS